MWRRRSSLSLTLHQSLCSSSSSSSSKLPNSHLHSSFFSSSSSSSSSAPNSLDLGFPKPDVAPPFSASFNISSSPLQLATTLAATGSSPRLA
ncbi:hypothetical protein CFP56_001699 [Quercus suber]|uniref:Uncharacterized protein n=1 Tax=Quercus suber TaxID=58331 RepID=A0AAW0IM98_QUESU